MYIYIQDLLDQLSSTGEPAHYTADSCARRPCPALQTPISILNSYSWCSASYCSCQKNNWLSFYSVVN